MRQHVGQIRTACLEDRVDHEEPRAQDTDEGDRRPRAGVQRDRPDIRHRLLRVKRHRRDRAARHDGQVRHDAVRTAAQIFDRGNQADINRVVVQQARAFGRDVVADVESRHEVEAVDERARVQVADGAQAHAVALSTVDGRPAHRERSS